MIDLKIFVKKRIRRKHYITNVWIFDDYLFEYYTIIHEKLQIVLPFGIWLTIKKIKFKMK